MRMLPGARLHLARRWRVPVRAARLRTLLAALASRAGVIQGILIAGRSAISDRAIAHGHACAHAPHRRIGPESCLLDLAAGAGLPAWRPTCSPPAVQHHLHPARARGATRPPWPLHPGAWCCVCVRWCDPTAHPHPRERRAGDNVRHHSVALWPRNLTPIGPRVE